MSTSQVLDRTFHIYRNHFVLLAGIGSLLPAMLLVMQLAFLPLGFPPRATAKTAPEALVILLLGYFCCYGVIYLVGTALAGGATVVGVSKLHLGQGVTIGEAYKQVFSRFWRIVGVIVLLGLIVFGSLFVGEIIALMVIGLSVGSASIFARGGGGLMSIGVVLAVIWAVAVFLGAIGAALFFYSKLALAIPACILEQLPVGVALRRSWYLTKGSVLRIMLVNLLTWVLGVVLGLALTIPGQVLAATLPSKAQLLGLVLQHIGGFIAGVLAGPIATTAIALIYYDQRVRKEAFDLQHMMELMGQQAPAQAATAAPPAFG
ncbi:MAG TPA: glycerophosphoryl diester phosphodiesterase membrane domain-containing protein [Candidatus Angelobacter sp.]|nr:glycerophosphoryl diester phosphodiesterase membrane domain-containing protein [Candidatus Angelobacter sp.]